KGRDGTTPAGSWDSGAGEGVWCHELKLPWILVRGDGPPHSTGERVTAVHIRKMHDGDLTSGAWGGRVKITSTLNPGPPGVSGGLCPQPRGMGCQEALVWRFLVFLRTSMTSSMWETVHSYTLCRGSMTVSPSSVSS